MPHIVDQIFLTEGLKEIIAWSVNIMPTKGTYKPTGAGSFWTMRMIDPSPNQY